MHLVKFRDSTFRRAKHLRCRNSVLIQVYLICTDFNETFARVLNFNLKMRVRLLKHRSFKRPYSWCHMHILCMGADIG